MDQKIQFKCGCGSEYYRDMTKAEKIAEIEGSLCPSCLKVEKIVLKNKKEDENRKKEEIIEANENICQIFVHERTKDGENPAENLHLPIANHKIPDSAIHFFSLDRFSSIYKDGKDFYYRKDDPDNILIEKKMKAPVKILKIKSSKIEKKKVNDAADWDEKPQMRTIEVRVCEWQSPEEAEAEEAECLASKPKSKKEIMKRAWQIATEAAKRFGGRKSEYFSQALKQSWKEMK